MHDHGNRHSGCIRTALSNGVGPLGSRLQHRSGIDHHGRPSGDRRLLYYAAGNETFIGFGNHTRAGPECRAGAGVGEISHKKAQKAQEFSFLCFLCLFVANLLQTSRSPVRMLYPCSTGRTKTRPSPISPVRAVSIMVLIVSSTISSAITSSIIIFGSSVTLYSVPRYTALCPFCRPWPRTSVTVMPAMLSLVRASFTSSSLFGRMIALMSFIEGAIISKDAPSPSGRGPNDDDFPR